VFARARCPICEDERQYVRQGGQALTTLDELAAQGNRVELRELEPGLVGVGAQPAVGIGQRALLVRTPGGNFLWDCFGFIDETSVDAIRAMGGIAGIAFSHPHFYGVMVEWSRAFGGCPIWIPSADRAWVQRDDPAIVEWGGTKELTPGLTLIQTGGHFEGSAVLHWAAGADGRGALLVGDTITVVPDVRAVSFSRSYPWSDVVRANTERDEPGPQVGIIDDGLDAGSDENAAVLRVDRTRPKRPGGLDAC